MPLWGIYIMKLRKIFSFFGGPTPNPCIDGGEMWHGGDSLWLIPPGRLLHAKFHRHQCNMSPLWGEKPQNRPMKN